MVIKADRMKFPRILTAEEVARMFRKAQIKGLERDEMLLKCLYYVGLKTSEVQRIRVEDLDINQNTILIKGSKGDKGRDKNKDSGSSSSRELQIPGKFPFELLKFTKHKRPDERVFSGRGPGKAMSDRHIRRIVKDYARMAEVRKYEEVKPHTLRISYAAHLRKDGVPVKSIQGLLGHARRETTYIYTHGLNKMGSENHKEKESISENKTK